MHARMHKPTQAQSTMHGTLCLAELAMIYSVVLCYCRLYYTSLRLLLLILLLLLPLFFFSCCCSCCCCCCCCCCYTTLHHTMLYSARLDVVAPCFKTFCYRDRFNTHFDKQPTTYVMLSITSLHYAVVTVRAQYGTVNNHQLYCAKLGSSVTCCINFFVVPLRSETGRFAEAFTGKRLLLA